MFIRMADQQGYSTTATYNQNRVQGQGAVEDLINSGAFGLGTYGSVIGTEDYDDFISDYSEADLEALYPETMPISPYEGIGETLAMPGGTQVESDQNRVLPMLFWGLSGGLNPYYNDYYYDDDDYYDDDYDDYEDDYDYDYEYSDYDEDDH